MCRLLLVDNSDSLNKIKEYSICKEYTIDEVRDCSSYNNILNKIIMFKPKVVFINIDNNNGLGSLEKLIKLKLDVKYIVVGSSSDYKNVREAFILGADDYILSTLNEATVSESILRCINESFSEDNQNERDPILYIDYERLSKKTNKIIKIVKEEYSNDITLNKIADKLKLNSGYLGREFYKETNVKFSEYLKLYRLNMAKNLITTGSETIATIAVKVGYTNSNYFYTHFKKKYGFSPTDLRKIAM